MDDVSIVGTGAVGTAAAGAILARGLASRLVFFDKIDEKAEGEALDFRHAGSLLPRCAIEARPFDALTGLGVCVLSAGVKSRPGETRLALLERNLRAAADIAERLEAGGLPRVLVVLTNPVDVMTEYFTRRWAGRGVTVFGSGTALDSQRLREALSTRLGVSAASVHAWVVGEHGDTSVPLFRSASVGCLSLEEFARQRDVTLGAGARDALAREVRTAAYEVIRRKGATAHAIGHTAAALVSAVVRDERIVVPVSVRVREGVCASLPCVLGREGPSAPLRPDFSPEEAAAFEASLAVLAKAGKAMEARPSPASRAEDA